MSIETRSEIKGSTQQPGTVFGGPGGPKPLAVYYLNDMRHTPPEEVDGQMRMDLRPTPEEELAELVSGPIANNQTNIPGELFPGHPSHESEPEVEEPETPEPTPGDLGQLTFDLNNLEVELTQEDEPTEIDDIAKKIRVPVFLKLRQRMAERKLEREETSQEKQSREEEVARFVGMSAFEGHNHMNKDTIVGVNGVGRIQNGEQSRPVTKSETKDASKMQDLVEKRMSLVMQLSSRPAIATSANMTPLETKNAQETARARQKIQKKLDKVDKKLQSKFGTEIEIDPEPQQQLQKRQEKVTALNTAIDEQNKRKQDRAVNRGDLHPAVDVLDIINLDKYGRVHRGVKADIEAGKGDKFVSNHELGLIQENQNLIRNHVQTERNRNEQTTEEDDDSEEDDE